MLKTDMRSCLKAFVLVLTLASLSFTAEAAGLGRITVLSALGQPLRAELEVSATRDEAQSLVAKVAPAEAFAQAGIEYVPALATLRFSRDIKERDGRRFFQITTDRPLNEPFIDMLVELSWASGRLVREFTFLLDPPDLVPASAAVIAPEVRPEAKTETATTHPVEQTPSSPAVAGGVTGDTRPAVPRSGVQAVQKPAPGQETPSTRTESRLPPKVADAPSASVAGTHKVVAGETLTKIAAQTKADGVSLEQMLVALFRSNSEAFAGNNMNRLRAGKILALPAREEAEKIPAEEAHHEILAQSADFNAYRKKLAAAVTAGVAKDEGVKQSASGKVVPKVEDKASPPGGGKDKLEVSRSEVAKDVKGSKDKAAQNRVALLEEELLARSKALEEANSRTAELEKNLSAMRKLAELKSQSGAALQQQAQATKSAPAAPPPAPQAQVQPRTPEPAKAAASAPAEAKPAEAAKPDEVPKPAAPPKPEKRPLPPPEPEPEPGFLEEKGLLVLGGGGVVTLLLSWLGFSALRKKRQAGAEAGNGLAAGGLSAHSVFSATTVAPPPSEQEPSQFSVTTAGLTSASADTMDALAEADTFLAFGRDAQAEEVLLAALEKEPERLPLYLKLLEIYAGRRNIKQFEAMAKRLQVQTGSNGPEWERALALGAGIDPENALYRPTAVAEPPAATAPAPAVAEPDFGATLVLSASPLTEAVAEKTAATVAESAAPAEPPPASAVNSGVIDFDLDLDLGSPGAPAESSAAAVPATPEATQVIRPAAEISSLDFDLDLGALEAPAPSAAAAAPLDLDLPLDKVESVAAAATDMPAATGSSSGGIDFDFDLGTADTSALSLAESAASQVREFAATAVAAPLDLGGVSLELESATASPAATPAATLKADDPEVATKLELATAYEEMGDKDGARELYQEALAEGSLAQQERARTRLAALS